MTGSHALVISGDSLFRSALEVSLPRAAGSVSRVTAMTLNEVAGGGSPGGKACPEPAAIAAIDVVVLDVGDDGRAAPRWCAAIGEQWDAPTLVLHNGSDVAVLAACLAAGASGFQTMDVSLDELGGALDAVLRGEAVIPRLMLGGLLKNLIDRRRQDEAADERFGRLTRREREILVLVAAGGDRNDIARKLFISPQTARTHIQNVLAKLDVHSRLDAATFAIVHGYADAPPGGR
jgi:DNA-binding NarL/FixJ family response regulator